MYLFVHISYHVFNVSKLQLVHLLICVYVFRDIFDLNSSYSNFSYEFMFLTEICRETHKHKWWMKNTHVAQ